jgi:hypothetical protein
MTKQQKKNNCPGLNVPRRYFTTRAKQKRTKRSDATSPNLICGLASFE